MAETTTSDVVDLQTRIDAAPETVFEFFTDPDKMIQWKGRKAELDPRPGGTYRVEINDQATAVGEYVVVEPHSRVVFTWGWEGAGNPVPPGSSTVEITLEPDGDGTIVRLVHSDLPEPARAPHTDGWKSYLERLTAVGEGRDPGPEPHGSTP